MMGTGTIGMLYGASRSCCCSRACRSRSRSGLSALVFMAIFMPTANLWSVAETMYSELDNFTLLTIPLFVLMGAAIGKTRAGTDVYGSLNAWLHKVPGGLGLANVFACSVFAAMCGSRARPPARRSARRAFPSSSSAATRKGWRRA